jgi:hypothetical protein
VIRVPHYCLVYGLVLLDVVQTVMVTADGFHWCLVSSTPQCKPIFRRFVYGFGNLAQLDETFLNSWDVPVLDSIIALCAQAFYCWRIYFLRKGVVIPVLILLVCLSLSLLILPSNRIFASQVSLTQFAAGIVTGVRVRLLSSCCIHFLTATLDHSQIGTPKRASLIAQ